MGAQCDTQHGDYFLSEVLQWCLFSQECCTESSVSCREGAALVLLESGSDATLALTENSVQ